MTDPSPAASKPLLLSRRFAPLFWCQFFSAFSDNFLKNALVFLILFKIGGSARRVADHAGGGGVHRALLLPVGVRRRDGRPLRQGDGGAAAEALPRSGSRSSPSSASSMHSVPVLFVALFVFGVIGSLFGPIKYGILPDLLDKLGTAGRQRAGRGRDLHGDPARHHRRRAWRPRTAAIRLILPALMMVFALLCWGSSLLIPEGRLAARPTSKISANIVASTGRLLRHLRGDQPAVVGRAGDELVLAGRRGGAVAAAAAGEERARRHRGGRHHASSRCSRSRSRSARGSRRGSRPAAS